MTKQTISLGDVPYAILTRLSTSKQQTLGEINIYHGAEKLATFKTLEKPDEGNEQDISRIPAGFYLVKLLQSSPSFNYPHYWITNVEGRTGVKFHRGNFYNQIQGCILPGYDFHDLNRDGLLDVTSSTKALEVMIFHLKECFLLEIR